MWDSTPVGALTHGSGLDGTNPLPRHISRDYYIRNGRPSLVLSVGILVILLGVAMGVGLAWCSIGSSEPDFLEDQ